MRKYFKDIINLIIIFLLIAMPTSVFAVDKSVTIEESVGFSVQFENAPNYLVDFAPGDERSIFYANR